MTADGPKVLEYNTRFGDPECQPLLMRLDGDLVDIMQAALAGDLSAVPVRQKPESALGVVVCAKGYPPVLSPRACPLKGWTKPKPTGPRVFHSGTVIENGVCKANGGRVLCVTALGKTLAEAQAKAYKAVDKIRMPDSFHRSDIGDKGIRRLQQQENARLTYAFMIFRGEGTPLAGAQGAFLPPGPHPPPNALYREDGQSGGAAAFFRNKRPPETSRSARLSFGPVPATSNKEKTWPTLSS